MDFMGKLVPIVVLLVLTANHFVVQGDTLQSSTKQLLKQFKSKPVDAVCTWSDVIVRTLGNDYDPEIAPTLDQPGSTLQSRALAMMHAAIYQAVVAFYPRYKSVFKVKNLPRVRDLPKEPTMTIAIMQGAYEILYALYPKQRTMFDAIRTAHLERIKESNPPTKAIRVGVDIGHKIASTILQERASDGSKANVTYTPNLLPGYHRVDPTRPTQGYDAPQWGQVTPFILDSVLPFRASPVVGETPSARLKFINSHEYIEAYEEDKSLGERFSVSRTADQTEIAKFWGYDGARKIGTFPRMCNQIVRVIATQTKNTLVENARLFAMVNFALADSRISAYNSKYHYAFWRPIVAIREGTASTPAVPQWLPLGAGADGNGDNFTPNHPSYPSGHVSSSGAAFGILREFYGKDEIPFKFRSDEFNGRTNDSITLTIRPATTRSYRTLAEAEEEVFFARILLGVHWRFDEFEALKMGHRIASCIYKELC